MDRDLSATVVVNAPEEMRIDRIARRDNLAREEIIARMRAQMSPGEISRRGDFVVENSGAEGELIERVKFIDRVLTLMLAEKTA
jgi:dephospho-CoA kinase